jgi:hypothetical protein
MLSRGPAGAIAHPERASESRPRPRAAGRPDSLVVGERELRMRGRGGVWHSGLASRTAFDLPSWATAGRSTPRADSPRHL